MRATRQMQSETRTSNANENHTSNWTTRDLFYIFLFALKSSQM